MKMQLGYNRSDDRTIQKNIEWCTTYDPVYFLDDTSVITPVIDVVVHWPRSDASEDDGIIGADFVNCNYCYIEDLHRYYFITDVTIEYGNVNVDSPRRDLYRFLISLRCDVLMSFKNDILNFNVVVDRQTDARHGDEYIDDGSLVTQNIMFNRVYNFSKGFNDNPEYILIAAG